MEGKWFIKLKNTVMFDSLNKLKKEIEDAITKRGSNTISIDLSEVDYIQSFFIEIVKSIPEDVIVEIISPPLAIKELINELNLPNIYIKDNI